MPNIIKQLTFSNYFIEELLVFIFLMSRDWS